MDNWVVAGHCPCREQQYRYSQNMHDRKRSGWYRSTSGGLLARRKGFGLVLMVSTIDASQILKNNRATRKNKQDKWLYQ